MARLGSPVLGPKELEAALRGAPGALVVHDTYGVCQWAGGVLLEELGHGTDEWIGAQGHDLFHPDDEAEAMANHERLLEHGEASIRQRLRSRNGWAWVRIDSRIVKAPERLIVSTVRLDETPEAP